MFKNKTKILLRKGMSFFAAPTHEVNNSLLMQKSITCRNHNRVLHSPKVTYQNENHHRICIKHDLYNSATNET